MIKVYEKDSKEYKALEAAAALMNVMSKTVEKGIKFTVQDVYFDLGQDWMWTTISAKNKDGNTWQVLCPRDHELITDVGNIDAITQAIRQALRGY